MARINGIQATAIAGLGQIGVGGSTPAPRVYPTGGLIANSGMPGPSYAGTNTTIWGVNGLSGSMPSWYDRPTYGTGASSASVWTKIVGNASVVYCLSSSGELFSAGTSYVYSGRPSAGFVNGRLDKVTAVTPTSSWTDISIGQTFVIGINDGYIWGTGAPNNGEFGSGSASYSNFGTWIKLSSNQGWVRVEAGQGHSCFMSGSSKASGSVWISGLNSSGRTGMNTTTGTTNNRAEPFGMTGSIFTDMSPGFTTTYLVSNSAFYGTGQNSSYQMGNSSTTDKSTFGAAISVAGYSVRNVFAGPGFGKVITTESFVCHTGNQTYARGDGSNTQLTAWTRLHTTSAEFSASWDGFHIQKFQNNNLGIVGFNRNRPYYLQPGVSNYQTVFPVENLPYQSASYKAGSTNNTTWQPFFSGSFVNNLNITGSHLTTATTTWASDVTNALTGMWMYLTPQ